MALARADIPRPMLPGEAVQVDELGGEVIVRSLTLSQRLAVGKFQDGDPWVAYVLSLCVVDSEKVPIFSRDEWEVFGASNYAVTMRLFDKAADLSGMRIAQKKENGPS